MSYENFLSHRIKCDYPGCGKRVREQDWPEVRQALWGDHFWSPSYCVVSCGGAPLEIVRKYIRDQQKPNRKYRRKTNR